MTSKRDKIKLVSTGVDEEGKPTKHFYTTTKNKRITTKKLEFNKYDPILRKHVLYKEEKLK